MNIRAWRLNPFDALSLGSEHRASGVGASEGELSRNRKPNRPRASFLGAAKYGAALRVSHALSRYARPYDDNTGRVSPPVSILITSQASVSRGDEYHARDRRLRAPIPISTLPNLTHQVQDHRHHGTFRPREVNHVPRRSSKGASVAKVRRSRCHQTPQPHLAPGTEPELPKLNQTQKLNAGT